VTGLVSPAVSLDKNRLGRRSLKRGLQAAARSNAGQTLQATAKVIVAFVFASLQKWFQTIVKPVPTRIQILVDDPSGNPVELFQPTMREARLGSARD
jgi:hypothetical protein